MHGLEGARRLLRQNDIVERVREVSAAEARVEEVERALRQVEHTIPWWERAAFFHDSPDERKAAELRERLDTLGRAAAQARRARDEAVEAWARTSPPIEIVFHVESVIARVTASFAIGREAGSGEAVAQSLDWIAERVERLWMPDAHLPALVAQLFDAPVAAPAGPIPAVPAADPRLVYAPIGAAELSDRALRHVAATGQLAQARERLRDRTLRAEALRSELARLEEAVGLFDRIDPRTSEGERARDHAAHRLREERAAIVGAMEHAHQAVVQGLAAAHPAAWIALGSRAAAAALRSVGGRREFAISAHGAVVDVPSAFGRAVALACLVELRRACDVAFPGLAELVWPRRADPDRSSREGSSPGPYRLASRPDAEPTVVTKGATERSRAFFASLERSELRTELSWAVLHATVLGVVDLGHGSAEDRVGWLDRVVFWSDSDDEAEARTLSRRSAWRRHLLRLHALRALEVVDGAAREHPFLRIGRAIAAAHLALRHVRTLGGSSGSPRDCPVIGGDEARAQLEHAVDAFCEHYGAVSDRGRLIEDVCARIVAANGRPIAAPSGDRLGYPELVDRFAARLQGSPFVAFVREIQANRPAAQHARAEQRSMEASVRLIDRLNIFTDSPAERARDAAAARAAQHERIISERWPAARDLYRTAISLHAPTLLADIAVEVAHAVAQIHAVSVRRSRTVGTGKNRRTETYYVCELRGRDAALAGLTQWTQQVTHRFGAFPCAGDLLEQWVAGELR